MRESALWAAPFDLERLEITGTETPIVEGVQVNSVSGDATYAFSDDGLLVYARGGDTAAIQGGSRTLVWVDRDGSETPIAVDPRDYGNMRLSPDGQRLAVSIRDTFNLDVWIYDLVRGTSSRLTFDPADDQDAIWTPDGESVVYYSASGEGGIVRRAANGTGEGEWLTTNSFNRTQNPETISPDGGQLVFSQNVGRNSGLYVLPMEGGADPEPLLVEDEYSVYSAVISPDGRWMAYGSNETDQREIYVRPFPNIDDGKWQVSTNGGGTSQWGPDGSELFMRDGVGEDWTLMVADVETESSFNVSGVPRTLFKGDYYFSPPTIPNYDVAPDGQRFIAMKEVGQDDPISRQTSVVFVRNWFEELKRLAPSDSP